jgi:hypothetical protein
MTKRQRPLTKVQVNLGNSTSWIHKAPDRIKFKMQRVMSSLYAWHQHLNKASVLGNFPAPRFLHCWRSGVRPTTWIPGLEIRPPRESRPGFGSPPAGRISDALFCSLTQHPAPPRGSFTCAEVDDRNIATRTATQARETQQDISLLLSATCRTGDPTPDFPASPWVLVVDGGAFCFDRRELFCYVW